MMNRKANQTTITSPIRSISKQLNKPLRSFTRPTMEEYYYQNEKTKAN